MDRPLAAHALAAAALGAAALAAGCASVDRTAPFREFAAGRYAAARAMYEADLAGGGAEQALDRCSAGTSALLAGDLEGAHRHFLEAFTDLEDRSATAGETARAVVGPERTKRWKGDPYERCMNAYYLGVTYWLRGDVDNAAACFKSGLLRDADSAEGAAQSDFALLWFLLGQAQREARHEDGGRFALDTAHRLLPDNPWLDPARNADANVLLVLDLGLGPVKVPTGPHGAWIGFRPRRYRAAWAEASADGHALGRTARAVDLYHQAVTRGDKVIDHVNQGKAIFKDAAVITGAGVLANSGSRESDLIGAGLILLGLLTPAEADVRQWDTLPGEVHVLLAKLPPGRHRLRVDVRDAAGAPLDDLSREPWVEVREGHTAFVWARAAPPPARDVRIDTPEAQP